jgi:beta-galactosidase/beta-glucuronidase
MILCLLFTAQMMTPWAEKVDPAKVLPEYPRPAMERPAWMNLNGQWQFEEAADAIAPLGRNLAAKILVPFPWESALSGVRKNFRRAWYRREFEVPAAWNEKRMLLHFGAVDWEALVIVDGNPVGSHQGGYDAFTFDITSHLKAGVAKHELIVGVYDPGNQEGIASGKQANDRFEKAKGYFYTGASGIWQTVWLEPVPKQRHIAAIHTVPDSDGEKFVITVNPDSQQGGRYGVSILVRDGATIVATKQGDTNAPVEVAVPKPKLWSPDSPHLYDIDIALTQGEKVIDRVKSYAGMRKIAIRRNTINGRDGLMRIELNNRFVFQFGPLDQGYWPDGIYTAPIDEALRWDIEQIRSAGFNMIRKHIKVEPARWYYWCDRLGVLVWQDMPSTMKRRTEQEKTQFETELQRMIKGLWNHPSIVNWIVFNEHWGAYDVERLTEMVMALDPSRLVTANSGMDAGRPHIDYEVGHIKDNHHYRPPTNPMANNRRAAVNGEYGAIGYKEPGHVWDTVGPWVHDTYKGMEDATVEYQKFAAMLLKFRKEDHLSGAVYTQWTDVENEMNGLYTYDRRKAKLDMVRVKKANEKCVFP